MSNLFGLCYGECGAVDYTVFFFASSAIGGFAVLFLWILYNVLDECLAADQISTAEIIGKSQEYEPPSTSMMPISTGKTISIIPIPRSARTDYRVAIKITDPGSAIDGACSDKAVRFRDFVRMKRGDKVSVCWIRGVFSNKWVLKEILLVK